MKMKLLIKILVLLCLTSFYPLPPKEETLTSELFVKSPVSVLSLLNNYPFFEWMKWMEWIFKWPQIEVIIWLHISIMCTDEYILLDMWLLSFYRNIRESVRVMTGHMNGVRYDDDTTTVRGWWVNSSSGISSSSSSNSSSSWEISHI